jgi:hypothetical protein
MALSRTACVAAATGVAMGYETAIVIHLRSAIGQRPGRNVDRPHRDARFQPGTGGRPSVGSRD